MPIHVIGGFRAPETNRMLRSRSAHTGVAEHSQHMLGKAVRLLHHPTCRRQAARDRPQDADRRRRLLSASGAPFVHFDVGSGRYWPRMSRQELTRIFPDGKTIHLPTDGKPLRGYAEAMASYKQRKGASRVDGGRRRQGGAAPLVPGRALRRRARRGGGTRPSRKAAPMLAKKVSPPPAPAPVPAAEPVQAKPRPPELPPGVAMADAGAFDASSRRRKKPPSRPSSRPRACRCRPTLDPRGDARGAEPDRRRACRGTGRGAGTGAAARDTDAERRPALDGAAVQIAAVAPGDRRRLGDRRGDGGGFPRPGRAGPGGGLRAARGSGLPCADAAGPAARPRSLARPARRPVPRRHRLPLPRRRRRIRPGAADASLARARREARARAEAAQLVDGHRRPPGGPGTARAGTGAGPAERRAAWVRAPARRPRPRLRPDRRQARCAGPLQAGRAVTFLPVRHID